MGALTAADYKVIASPSDYWYLDHADNNWKVMYGYDPTMDLDENQRELIIGGEVCMWGEHIDDSNIEQVVYPRAASVAERLWSPETVNDTTEALSRLIIQRLSLIHI